MVPQISLAGSGTPEKILAAFGFLPFSVISSKAVKWRCSRILSKALFCVAIMFITGGALRGAIEVMRLVYLVVTEPTTERGSPTLKAMSEFFGFFPIESVFVLSIFILKRKSWYNVQVSLREITRFGNTGGKKLAAWKRTGSVLSCITLLATILFEYGEWRTYFDENPQEYTSEFQEAYAPLPIRVTGIDDCIVWIVFCSLPHYFSHQVYICVIVNCVILRDACDEFLDQIAHIRSHKNAVPTEAEITATVKEMQNFHLKLVRCMNKLNDIYSWILLVIFFSKMAMACSFLTTLIVLPSTAISSIISNYSSVAIFFIYAAGFAIPLVQVYEKAGSFALKLYQLQKEMTNHSSASRSEQILAERIHSLEEATRRFVPCFTGGGIIYYSRNLLTTACTFLITTGLLVQEIASNNARFEATNPSVPDCRPGCNNNSNGCS